MNLNIRLTAYIQEIDAIRRCLFPTDDHRGSDNWLHHCKIAVSPIADLLVLANERKVVVLTSKWNAHSSLNQFEITHSGPIHDYDKVKAVLCLPIIGCNGNTQLGSEWTCILVGFDSGHVRCYTENCELLFEERFHAENITTIKCQSQHSPKPHISPDLSPEEIYVQYQSNICVLSGYQLCNVLRTCKLQLENGGVIDHLQSSITPKKWGFQDQSIINDSAVVGLNLSSTFDHLLTASICGGFDSKYRAMPPHNTLVLAAGSKPFLGYHYALEGGAQPVLSDVAKAVASKLKSALPGWLTGNKSQSDKQMSIAMLPAEAMGCRFGLCDLRRTATEVLLSPDRKLAAVSDALGRVLLVDSAKGIVLRIFKGYRDAQCSFLQVPEEKTSKHRLGNKVALFLVIYTPKKGTLEFFSVQKGSRIATFSASKHSRLLYINYGLMGFANSSRSKFICPYTTVLIDNDGQIKDFTIPFHFALAEKNSKRSRDIHLYKKLRHLIKSGECEEDKLLSETVNTCTELKTIEIKSQTVDMLLTNKHAPPRVTLQAVQYFADNLIDEEADQLKVMCGNASILLSLYLFVTISEINDIENGNADQLMSTFTKLEEKEMGNLQKLLDLSISNDYDKLPEVHVSFSDNALFSVTEFLSIFEMSKADSICIKDNIDECVLFKSSEILFKRFIAGSPHGFEEDFQARLTSSKISTKNLFDLLVNYWVSRSLHINLNLEKEMFNLSRLIHTLAKTSSVDKLSTEYSEISKFWKEIRDILADSARPFPALIAAILCKSVAQTIDSESQMDESSTSLEDDSLEILSQENVQWSLLIGKLEDISLLNIVLSKKPVVEDCPLPLLEHEKFSISLKYVLQKGKGSVTELVAKWLTSTGINPQSIILNDKISGVDEDTLDSEKMSPGVLGNEKVFEQLNLLKQQFPYSLETSTLLANMVWEYALAWQKDIQDLGKLEAAISCLCYVQDLHIKQGLYQLLWNTHLKIVIESACKLINKVGKLPKERLCRQDTSLSDYQISLFIRISTEFLDNFMDVVQQTCSATRPNLTFENIWENAGGQALVELAVLQKEASYELLLLHYQLCLVLQMITIFSVKHSKPINNLFEGHVVNLFFTDLQRKPQVACNRSDLKLSSSRIEFLFKIITASMESITLSDSGAIHSAEHVTWMGKCCLLARFWNLEVDILRRFQIIRLFANGYDSLGEELIPAVNEVGELGKFLLNIAAKRLAQFLALSPALSENISALSTSLTKFMDNLDDEWCETCPLQRITRLATHSLRCLDENSGEYKIAQLLLEACNTLEEIRA
ncbi:unnamed protein product [Phaedon cochleariae]|uniref:Rab3 GTPase-activating protein non-catalytic subunit n=1 Tax=Phaedon cochleariae TaxID=80249 RepID=A0A9P0GRC0_PHACE|nr:unnamed protein product [Phaedon cochleariae]